MLFYSHGNIILGLKIPQTELCLKTPMVLVLKIKRYKGKGSIFNCKSNIVYMYYNAVTK